MWSVKSVSPNPYFVILDVLLAVNEDKTREVFGVFNKPTESAHGWGEMLNDIYERGVGKIGLVWAALTG